MLNIKISLDIKINIHVDNRLVIIVLTTNKDFLLCFITDETKLILFFLLYLV